MNKLKLFLTFDHELPLGGLNTDYQNAMFDPTEKVLKLAEEENVKVTLFTDILCALRFKGWHKEGFYEPYVEQLKRALLHGHDVQLHLHPHWMTSNYSNNSFTPSNDFALSDFKDREYPNDIAGIIEKGYSFLQSICSDVKPDYKCVAYRAGGYNISPSTDVIFSELYKQGIRFDSSICKGYYFKSALSEINFYNTLPSANWFINKKGEYTENAKDGILEIPIAGKPKSLFEVPTRFKLKKYKNRAPENRGMQIHEGKPVGMSYRLKQLFSSRMLSFDNYTYSPEYLLKVLDYHIQKHSKSETILVSVIGHPKSMSEYSLFLMKSFIKEARKKYSGAMEFLTYSDLPLHQE